MNVKILDEGRELHLPVKTLEVIRGVIEVSPVIESIASGRITFHFKGRSVIPEVTRFFRSLKSEEPTDKV